jgi:hypothetical protein
MPKFKNLLEAFGHIKENPLDYLPEKSLSLFRAFWDGYSWRYEIEFNENETFRLPEGFIQFINQKYRNETTHGPFSVINLYSRNEAEAFDNFFENLNDFVSQASSEKTKFYVNVSGNYQRTSLFALLKEVRKRPAMYVGSNSFTLVATMISGWLRAINDFELEESEEEQTFRAFQQYIELKDINLPSPPWNKIIWFHSMSEDAALKLFFEYLDEFAFQKKNYVESVEFRWRAKHDKENWLKEILESTE